MTDSPFKFLDSYNKEDKAIFFGRDREIEEIYQKVFESKILLIYGISGTGKTSLINCGLANKFEESDWLPVNVRRGVNIVDSLWKELEKVAITPVEGTKGRRSEGEKGRGGEGANGRAGEGASGREEEWEKGRIGKAIQSIYLDHFKPIYLIFDQFEELFIFGSRKEREEFIEIVKEVVDADIQCKLIFSIREEYLASVTEFELTISDFLSNRMRIEKMTRQHAIEAIEGPCKVHGIEVEEGFANELLRKLNPEAKDVELTYLQVFLDKVYKMALDENGQRGSSPRINPGLGMTWSLLGKVGDVSDLLGSFLEEQVNQLEDPDTGLVVLKAFVSMQGTKKQINEQEIAAFARTLGKPLEKEKLTDLLQRFVNLRVLKDKDESGRYELRHDSLATKIYEKITLVEKELLEIKDFLDNAYMNYERRGVYLVEADLKYIAPYDDKLFLSRKLNQFIADSRNALAITRRRRRRILSATVISVFLILLTFTIWAVIERSKATRALKEKEAAEKKLEETAKDFVMSAANMNILFKGIENPLLFAIPGMPTGRYNFNSDRPASMQIHNKGGIIIPYETGIINISLDRIVNNDTIRLGIRSFQVRNLPDPVATLNGKKSGYILRDELASTEGIKAVIKGFNYDYEFQIISYELSFGREGGMFKAVVKDNKIPDAVRNQMKTIPDNSVINFKDIRVMGPDDVIRNIGTLSLTVIRWFSFENDKVFYSLIDDAVENKDWDALMKLGTENLKKYYWDRPEVLNNVAYKFYFNFLDSLFTVSEGHPVYSDIQNALEWSERAVELKNNDPDYLDTYAALLFRLGRWEEAETTMRKVIEILKDRGEPTQDKEIFLGKIQIFRKGIERNPGQS